jgi:hypothetical protein
MRITTFLVLILGIKKDRKALALRSCFFSAGYGFTGAMCQSSQRLPLIVTESVRFMESIPAGVQQSMSHVYGV